MTRKTSALIAVMLISSFFVIADVVMMRVNPQVFIPTLIGTIIGFLMVAAIPSTILGFIGGAFKKGAFNDVFYYSYIVFLLILTLGRFVVR